MRERDAAIKRPTKAPREGTKPSHRHKKPPPPPSSPSSPWICTLPKSPTAPPVSLVLRSAPPMRIRRRPPGQPVAYLLPSDPYPATQSPPPAPRDHQERPPLPEEKQGEGELHLRPAANDSPADLGDARSSSSSPLRRPALPPQDGAVERGRGLLGAQQQQQQPQQGPVDGRTSPENGLHRHVPEPMTIQAGEHLSNNNGVGAAVAVTPTATTGAKATKKQQETKDTSGGGGGTKRAPRGSGELMEGSRCSRKNGRGWRCSQPTMVGYSLCQYHLGKGRMKSGSAAATGRRGPGQLGRTEHAKKTSATALSPAPATAAAPEADVSPPPPTSVEHR